MYEYVRTNPIAIYTYNAPIHNVEREKINVLHLSLVLHPLLFLLNPKLQIHP